MSGSPCLSKTGPVYGPFFFKKIFLGSITRLAFSRPVNGPKDPWPRVLSFPGALDGLLETPPRWHVTICSLTHFAIFRNQIVIS